MKKLLLAVSALATVCISEARAEADIYQENNLASLTINLPDIQGLRVAGVQWMPDYFGSNLTRSSSSNLEKTATCAQYKLYSASDCPEGREPSDLREPKPGLRCYARCVCSKTKYPYTIANCVLPNSVGGDYCSDANYTLSNEGKVLAFADVVSVQNSFALNNPSLASSVAWAENKVVVSGGTSGNGSSPSSTGSVYVSGFSPTGMSASVSQNMTNQYAVTMVDKVDVSGGSTGNDGSSSGTGGVYASGLASGVTVAGLSSNVAHQNLYLSSAAVTSVQTSGVHQTLEENNVPKSAAYRYTKCSQTVFCSTYGYTTSSTVTNKTCTKVAPESVGNLDNCYNCMCKSEFKYSEEEYNRLRQVAGCINGRVSCEDSNGLHYKIVLNDGFLNDCAFAPCAEGYTPGLAKVTCSSDGDKYESQGYHGPLICGKCTHRACPQGYSVDTATCPRGYQLETNSTSGGKACGKCVVALCPTGYDVNTTSCSNGYKLETNGYSASKPCGKCTATTCPTGYNVNTTSCSNGYKFETSGYSAGKACGKCTATTCPTGYDVNTTSCSNGYKFETSGYSAGKACGKCVQMSCSDGGYVDSCPSGSSGTSIVFGGKTCYKDCKATSGSSNQGKTGDCGGCVASGMKIMTVNGQRKCCPMNYTPSSNSTSNNGLGNLGSNPEGTKGSLLGSIGGSTISPADPCYHCEASTALDTLY